MIELQCGRRSVAAPVWTVPGHADGAVTVHLGYGRTRAGRVGTNLGFNAFALRTAEAPWIVTRATVRRTGGRYQLAVTQAHHVLEGDSIARVSALENELHAGQKGGGPAVAGQTAGPERAEGSQRTDGGVQNKVENATLYLRATNLPTNRPVNHLPAQAQGMVHRPDALLLAAMPVLLHASQKTTFRSSERRESWRVARCTGFASMNTIPARPRIPGSSSNRCSASTANRPLVKWSVLLPPQRTVPRD